MRDRWAETAALGEGDPAEGRGLACENFSDLQRPAVARRAEGGVLALDLRSFDVSSRNGGTDIPRKTGFEY